jgi:hypothetical protein
VGIDLAYRAQSRQVEHDSIHREGLSPLAIATAAQRELQGMLMSEGNDLGDLVRRRRQNPSARRTGNDIPKVTRDEAELVASRQNLALDTGTKLIEPLHRPSCTYIGRHLAYVRSSNGGRSTLA